MYSHTIESFTDAVKVFDGSRAFRSSLLDGYKAWASITSRAPPHDSSCQHVQ